MKIFAFGKSVEVKRGDLIDTSSGTYKFIGRRNSCLYSVREMRYAEKSGNFYPVKGEEGLHSWTAGEVVDAVLRGV